MIITLDDFGLNRETNKEILNWMRTKKVDFVSLLVNSSFTDEALRIYQNSKRNYNLGLHFNLIEGRPLCKKEIIASLVNKKGYFYSLPQFILRLFFGLIRKEDVMRELQEQYDFLVSNNIKCVHINSHQNIHVFHLMYSYIEEFARKNNIKYIRQVQTVKNRLRKFPVKYLSFIILYNVSSLLYPSYVHKPTSFIEITFHPGTTYDL